MDVDRHQPGHVKDGLGQNHAIGGHKQHVGLIRGQLVHCGRILEGLGLVDGQVLFQGQGLNRAGMTLLAPAARPVGLRVNRRDRHILAFQNLSEHRCGELRRSHGHREPAAFDVFDVKRRQFAGQHAIVLDARLVIDRRHAA